MSISAKDTLVIDAYLKKYGEPETHCVPTNGCKASHVLVIPAFQENLADIERVFSKVSEALIVLVVNSPTADDPVTAQLLEDIQNQWKKTTGTTDKTDSISLMTWYQTPSGHHALVIDRCNNPIGIKQGVGKARKIGADIACRMFLNGTVKQPWIHLTDADAILPPNYLATINDSKQLAFELFKFDHKTESDLASALYEFSLLWYAFGLAFAESPYGYPSMGSCIKCNTIDYAKVRGIPSRAAGEDFYLLNKLRKIGNFRYTDCDPVILSNRRSTRVPFGTGPGINKIENLNTIHDMEFYHPQVFVELKSFLKVLHSSHGATEHGATEIDAHFPNPLHRQFAINNGLMELLTRQQTQKPSVYSKFIDDWFDGFRTLKFIHYVRDNLHSSVRFDALWQSELLPWPAPEWNVEGVKSSTKKLWYLLT